MDALTELHERYGEISQVRIGGQRDGFLLDRCSELCREIGLSRRINKGYSKEYSSENEVRSLVQSTQLM